MTKITSQKTLFSGKYSRLLQNDIDYGSNITRKHIDFYTDDAVNVFAIDENYEIYLVKQYRYLLGKDTLEAVAGIIDKNESPIKAAKRELKEEIGITANSLKIVKKIYLAASFQKSYHYLVLATGLSFGPSSPEETENTKMIKISLDNALKKVENGEIDTSMTTVGILLLDKMRKQS